MGSLLAYGRSSLGKKTVAAVTGAILSGFLVLHVVGNLKAFLGVDAAGRYEIDTYARFLRVAGEPLLPAGFVLWSLRVVLGVSLVAHVLVVTSLALQNRSARPVGYALVRYRAASVSARWMFWTGLALLVFVVLHILHFTTGTLAAPGWAPQTVYANLQRAFSRIPVTAGYVIAMVLLALHLRHGVWSAFQTAGWDGPRRNAALRRFAAWGALALALAFAALPQAFAAGWLPAPGTAAAAPAVAAGGVGGR
jgi:succinate dehydrogenase / fumarate reductase cytochrome b subunit